MAHRILVTGGLGYIGTHVVASLLEQGCEVITLDVAIPGVKRQLLVDEEFVQADCADASATQSRLDMIGPVDGVIHLAAMVEAPQSMLLPEVFYRVNAAGTLNMLELATRLSAKAFVFASSAAVYGSLADKLQEDAIGINPENPYGGSKLFGERICQDVAHRRQMSLGVLRFFNVVGAREDLAVRPPNTNLLGRIFNAVRKGEDKISIFGGDHKTRDGSCMRDFVSVNCVAEGVIRTLFHLLRSETGYRSLSPMNIGTGVGTTVYDVFACAKRKFPSLRYELLPARPGEISVSVSDTTRVEKVLGWKPRQLDINTAISQEHHVRFRNQPSKSKRRAAA